MSSPDTTITLTKLMSSKLGIGLLVGIIIIIIALVVVVYTVSSKSSNTGNASTSNLLAGLAGTGGVLLMLLFVGGIAYSVMILGAQWHYAVTAAILISTVVGLILTSITFSDPPSLKAIIISQAVIFGFASILLGFLATYYIGTDYTSMNSYMMIVLTLSIFMSVVALTATAMIKITSKPNP